MKDFTTPEYIAPILAELDLFFYPVKTPCVLSALNCNLLLQSKRTRNALVIRAGEPFFCLSNSTETRKLYKELNEWTETAETYPGELDGWKYNEEKRIQNAIRDSILEKYAD